MFAPGDLVVCVEDRSAGELGVPNLFGRRWDRKMDGLTKGQVYTIREWVDFWPSSGLPGVRLLEIYRPPNPYYGVETPFRAARFRPITRDRLEIFRSILRDAPVDDKEAA